MDNRLIERRLRMLEERSRFFQTVSILSAGVVVVVLASAQGPGAAGDNAVEELRARRFVLVDKEDRTLADLGVATEDGSVRLIIRNGSGAWLGVRADGTAAVALLRPSGLARVQLDGGEKESGLTIFGGTDIGEYISLRTAPGKSSALRMFATGGKRRIMLGTETDGPWTGLYLSDEHGQKRASVFVEEKGATGFGVWNSRGNEIWKSPSPRRPGGEEP